MEVLTRVEADRIAHLRERDEFFWLDLCNPPAEDVMALGQLLGLHPLALEDTREWGQRPKLDTYGDHLLLVYYTARVDETDSPSIVEPLETHIYVSGGFVVTVGRSVTPQLDALHDVLAVAEVQDEEDHVVYQVLDGLTDAFIPVLAAIESAVDELEDAVLLRVRRDQLTLIYRLKQDVQQLQRLIAPQRAAMGAASAAILELPGLTRGSHPYLRDIVDHLEQVSGDLQRHAADLSSLLDTFFNANTNRLNRIVTLLTVYATFFLVWTLVTSFFGQNFGWLVGSVDSRTDFLVYGLGGLIVPTVALAVFFWVRRDEWW